MCVSRAGAPDIDGELAAGWAADSVGSLSPKGKRERTERLAPSSLKPK